MSPNLKVSKLTLSILSALAVPSVFLFAGELEGPDKQDDIATENFHFNSQQFGIDAPFVIGGGHSKQLGTIIDGRYNYLFNENMAFSLGLEAGLRNYRISTTFAHAFSPTDRAKFTVEALRQKRKYIFRSGEIDEWVGQRGLGVEYEHLNPGKFVSDFHIAASAVKSDSKELSDERWLSENATEFEVFNNERRIAGATRRGVLVGLGLSPRASSRLKLDLNYDSIKYDTSLSGPAQNISGAGASLAWAEQLTDKTSLNLSASARKPYNRYQAKISHRLGKQLFKQPATLQFGTSHQVGKLGLEDDNRVTVSLAFGSSNGSKASHTSGRQYTAVTAQDNLLEWTSQPALYESSVLAQADQKAEDERLVVATKTDLTAISATIDKNGDITVNSAAGVAISRVTENGTAISFSRQQFRLENGVLVIGVASLNAPAVYFVAVEQADGQFTHVSFATFQGSIGISFAEVTPDQATADEAGSDATSKTQNTSAASLSNVSVNENTSISILTYQAFSGERLRFSASGLPSGLSINSNTGAITGTTPNVIDVDSISELITVTATDSGGISTSLSFTLTIVNSDRSDDTPTTTIVAEGAVTTCTDDPITLDDGSAVFINNIDGACDLSGVGTGAVGASFTVEAQDANDNLVDILNNAGGLVFNSGNGAGIAEGAQTVVVTIGVTQYSVAFDAQNNAGPNSTTISGVTITEL